MKRSAYALIVAGVLAFGANQAAYAQMTPEQRVEEMKKLHWEIGGTHKLKDSNSTLAVPGDHGLVTGSDAKRFEELVGNKGETEKLEAVVLNQADEQILFQAVQEGYVNVDDWKEINAKDMLRDIAKNTETSNVDRIQDGLPPLHIVGWLQEPTLDRATNTVFWAIDAKQGDENVVNARALKLGRQGFELVTWIGAKNAYKPIGGELDLMLRAFNFDPGSRYADFTEGDKVAAYTIAGLVAALTGAKLIKIVAAGGLLLLLKKFGGIVVIIIGAVLIKFRKLFRRKKAA